jgi:hypothetical protein
MKTKLIACACAFGLLIGYSSVTLAGGKQPDDAIKQNIDKNQAFDYCNQNAVSNGHVVFGGNSAINPLSGSGSANKTNTGTSAVVSPQSEQVCGLQNSQRVEPRSWWDSLAHIFTRTLAGAQKPAQ